MLKDLLKKSDNHKIHNFISKMKTSDVIQLTKDGFITQSFARQIFGTILNTNKDIPEDDKLFFCKFILVNDLYQIDDLGKINDSIYDFFWENIYNYPRLKNTLTFDFKKTPNQPEILNFLTVSQYHKIIEKSDYSLFFIDESNLIHYLLNEDFVFLTKDFMKRQNKEKIFFIYFKEIFKRISLKEDFSNNNYVLDFIKAISILECQNLLNQIDISKLNSKEYSLYEIIISKSKSYLTEEYKEHLFFNKLKFYKSSKIIIEHLCSISYDDYFYKTAFKKSIEQGFFSKNTTFIKDFSNEKNDDLFAFLFKNDYITNKIIHLNFILMNNINPIEYLEKLKHLIDEESLLSFLHHEDQLILKLLDIKYFIFNNGFIEDFINDIDLFLDNKGRLTKDAFENITLNYKL